MNLEHGKKSSEVIPESGKQNIKGCDIEMKTGDEDQFNNLQEEFLAFKKRMAAGRDNKKKFNKKGQGYKGRDRRGGRDNDRKTRVPAGKRTTERSKNMNLMILTQNFELCIFDFLLFLTIAATKLHQ